MRKSDSSSAGRKVAVTINWMQVLLLIAGFALTFLLQQASFAAEEIGKVISSVGSVVATGEDGVQRPLKRRAEIFKGDAIRTDPSGGVQIRFSDGSLLSLKPDTDFKVNEYQFQSQAGGNKAEYELLKGGMRTITGFIGKDKKDDYAVKTPVASIGIRGTHYELLMTTKLVAAVWSGGIRIHNDGGDLDLEKDEGYQFATVESATESPEGLLEAPESLQQPLQEMNDETVDSEEGDGQKDEGSAAEDGTTGDTSNGASSSDEGSSDGTADAASLEGFSTSQDLGDTGDLSGDTLSTDTSSVDSFNLTTSDTTTTIVAPVTSTAVDCAPDDLSCQVVQTTPVSDPVSVVTATGASAPLGSVAVGSFLTIGAGYLQGEGFPVSQGTETNAAGVAVTGDLHLDASGNLVKVDFNDGLKTYQFQANDASLLDAGANTGLQASWGRWSGKYLASLYGVGLPTVGSYHFMVSTDGTSATQLQSFTSAATFTTLATFSYAGGTSPTDHNNVAGTVDQMYMAIDPHNLWFVDAVLGVTANGKQFTSALAGPFTPLARIFSLPMLGVCQGANCPSSQVYGYWSGAFVGDGVGGIVSNYNLLDSTGTTAIVGAALLTRDPYPSNVRSAPFGSPAVAAIGIGFSSLVPAQSANPPSAYSFVSRVAPLNLANASYTGTEVLLNSLNQPLYILGQNPGGLQGTTCLPCAVFLNGSVTAQEVGGDTLGVNWGRWATGTNGSITSIGAQGTGREQTNHLHFIYTENITPDSQVSFGTPLAALGVARFTSLAGMRTNPTDQSGNVGSYVANPYLDVNFTSLLFSGINMQFSINGVGYALNTLLNYPTLADVHRGLAQLQVSGICSGGACGAATTATGYMNALFVGPNAEGLVGSFGASTALGGYTATGVGFFKR